MYFLLFLYALYGVLYNKSNNELYVLVYHETFKTNVHLKIYTQRSVQPDQCYFTVQITSSNFECNFLCNSTVIVCIVILYDGKYDSKISMH